MAAAPGWKVYDSQGVYQAACHQPEAAAALMGLYGDGATIRWGHERRAIKWTEGSEVCPGWTSYDTVAETCIKRRTDPSFSVDPKELL